MPGPLWVPVLRIFVIGQPWVLTVTFIAKKTLAKNEGVGGESVSCSELGSSAHSSS